MKKEVFLFLFLTFFSALLVFGDKRGMFKRIRGILDQPILAIEEKIYSLSISASQFLNPFSSKKRLLKEIAELREENWRLVVDQNALSLCLEENEQMRKLLGAPLPAKWKFLPAKVVGIGEEMRVDKGEKDGVETGMMVVEENILVGKVKSVSERSSIILLPTTPGQKIPVLIKRPGKGGVQARGILEASGGLILSWVLQSEDIQKGDLVVTGGEDWLPDLLVGLISEVLPKSAEIYQKARVKPLVEYDKLRMVFVIISK